MRDRPGPDGALDLTFDLENRGHADGLALPPMALSMGYPDDEEHYLESGRSTAAALRSLMERSGIDPSGATVLDWGCSTGRILRHLRNDAVDGEYWGVDQMEASVEWAKRELSPPFRFATTSSYPHLPFESNTFDFAYGLSVLTHLETFRDAWLLELRRVLRAGGILAVTVWDDDGIPSFRRNGPPDWWPEGLSLDDPVLDRDVVAICGREWGSTHVFYRRAYIERTWSAYFEIEGFVEHFYTSTDQTLVVLRKPARPGA